jgi:hypothetical protein
MLEISTDPDNQFAVELKRPFFDYSAICAAVPESEEIVEYHVL